jgi:hypothetical protein
MDSKACEIKKPYGQTCLQKGNIFTMYEVPGHNCGDKL